MGMSASQARLLSITSRLTNNEFRSQTITNSKLRLATESQEASQDYMDALNSKQLMFMNYDDNGTASKVELTPAVLYDYAPMKNQYMITNSTGKYLVSYTDAQNFENSDDLFQFLKQYDLTLDVTDTVNDKIKEDWQKMRDEKYADYEKRHKEWETIMSTWTGVEYNNEVYDKFASRVGTSQSPIAFCYNAALGGNPGCYLHLLNELLDFDGVDLQHHTYNTSYKDTSTGNYDTVTTNAAKGGMWDYGTHDHDEVPLDIMHDLSEEINNPENTCDGADIFTPYYNNDGINDKLEGNIIQDAIDEGRTPTKYEILKSDYIYDPETNSVTGVKTVKQKAIDLYYLIQYDSEFPELTADVMKETLINFTEGDLKMVKHTEPPVEPEWTEPDPPELKEGIVILRDQEKSQWYTNLWHALNGSDTSNIVDVINFDSDIDYIQAIPDDIKSEYRFMVENKTKDTKQTNYELLDSNLNGSSEWLQFALEHGVVTLRQAQYYNPDENSNKTANLSADGYKWNNIVYTSARDFVQQDDQKSIALAEVKYKKRITEIENKDTKFDQDLKKLDTEHNALMTEYESIKEVLSKNVERSFKAFS